MTRRLTAAFAGVALIAIAVLAALTIWAARAQVSDLVGAQNDATAAAVTAELAVAYAANGSSWDGADLRPARALAAAANASVLVRDAAGRTVAGPGPGGGPPAARRAAIALGPPVTVRVVVAGNAAGSAELRFPLAQPAPERRVRDALARAVAAGSALALLVAVGAGVLAAGWIRRPLAHLTSAAVAMSRGDLDARAGPVGGAGDVRELAAAFDTMAENVQREDHLRRALVADVAHELRTPVAIVQGELEAMLDGVRPADAAGLGSVHEESLRLGRLVEDLGTLSAARAAGLSLRREPVDLAAIASAAVAAAMPSARASGVAIATDLVPASVDGDPLRLTQIARNLLANAVKFTPDGGTVRVATRREDGAAVLEVEDTGPGIPEADLPHVFERFWRGPRAVAASGSGIGLAVVAELSAAHGGTATAGARPGGGARLTVRIPLAAS